MLVRTTRVPLDAGADDACRAGQARPGPILLLRADPLCPAPAQVKLLQYLAGKGADLGLADHEGRTAAHEAARCGQLEALRALARLGADLRATTRLGQTALDLAKGQEVRWVVICCGTLPCQICCHPQPC
jgi:hypothetical protein